MLCLLGEGESPRLAQHRPRQSHSILAALFNAVFLLVAVGAIGWEAIQGLLHLEPVAGVTVIVAAAAGILVNGVTAYLFAFGRKGDLNIRGAYMHMAADAAVSVGVVVAGLIILFTGWIWLDAATSLVISAVIMTRLAANAQTPVCRHAGPTDQGAVGATGRRSCGGAGPGHGAGGRTQRISRPVPRSGTGR
jgi:hypothetical protein